MAATFVSSAVPSGNPTTSFTITIPTVAVDDILILAATNKAATADPTVTDNDTGGNAWAKVISGNNGTGNLSVWWKRATSATSAKTITASGFTNSCSGVLHVWRGCSKASTPYASATYETNASANESHAGFTPALDGCPVFLAVGNATNDIAVTNMACTSPGTLAHFAEKLSTGGTDCSCALGSDDQVTAGATGNFTWSQTDAASMSITFYLRPLVEMNAEPGSYTITGSGATLLATRVMNAEPGSYVITGVDAALSKGFQVNIEPGTYTITGFEATLQQTKVMNAEPGVYTISGADATLAKGFLVNLEPGAYSITGFDITAISAKLMNAEPGIYAVTGADATPLAARLLNLEPGVYSVTGFDAELISTASVDYEMNAEVGVYVITGFDADLSRPAIGGGGSGLPRDIRERLKRVRMSRQASIMASMMEADEDD